MSNKVIETYVFYIYIYHFRMKGMLIMLNIERDDLTLNY